MRMMTSRAASCRSRRPNRRSPTRAFTGTPQTRKRCYRPVSCTSSICGRRRERATRSLATGGGLDVVITRAFAWRLINIQYTHAWMGGVENIHPDNGFRITAEAVLRIGTR